MPLRQYFFPSQKKESRKTRRRRKRELKLKSLRGKEIISSKEVK